MLYFYYLSLSSLETYICTERQVVQNLKIALKLDEKIKKFKFWNLVMFISIPWTILAILYLSISRCQ